MVLSLCIHLPTANSESKQQSFKLRGIGINGALYFCADYIYIHKAEYNFELEYLLRVSEIN